MSQMEKIKKEIEALREKINNHNYKYYIENQPVISDKEYDQLIYKLSSLEEQYPQLITPDSPTQRVGSKPAKEFVTTKHLQTMLSLANAFGYEDLIAFDNRLKKMLEFSKDKDMEYVAELKIDGLAVNLTYEDGLLQKAATRGDGIEGEEITNNVKTIKSIPLRLRASKDTKLPDLIEVRGEIYLEHAEFHRINKAKEKAGEPLFANPRNAAAGSVRQLDSKITAGRKLDIFIYGVGAVKGKEFKTQWEVLHYLAALGLRTNKVVKLCSHIDEVIEFCQEWDKKKKDLPYDADGYAIVPGSEKRRFGRIGIDDSEVFTMPFRDVSAIVSDAPVIEYELTEENARRHDAVLRKLLVSTTVLPAEFGTVLGDEGVLIRLLDRAYVKTKECIRYLDNLVELGLKVVLKKDAVIARRDELRSRCTEALEELRKVSEQTVHGELFTDRLLLNESFLVRRDKVDRFSDEVAKLREEQPTMKFLYSGPWAPYNFVHLKIGRQGIEFRREGVPIGNPPR